MNIVFTRTGFVVKKSLTTQFIICLSFTHV